MRQLELRYLCHRKTLKMSQLDHPQTIRLTGRSPPTSPSTEGGSLHSRSKRKGRSVNWAGNSQIGGQPQSELPPNQVWLPCSRGNRREIWSVARASPTNPAVSPLVAGQYKPSAGQSPLLALETRSKIGWSPLLRPRNPSPADQNPPVQSTNRRNLVHPRSNSLHSGPLVPLLPLRNTVEPDWPLYPVAVRNTRYHPQPSSPDISTGAVGRGRYRLSALSSGEISPPAAYLRVRNQPSRS